MSKTKKPAPTDAQNIATLDGWHPNDGTCVARWSMDNFGDSHACGLMFADEETGEEGDRQFTAATAEKARAKAAAFIRSGKPL